MKRTSKPWCLVFCNGDGSKRARVARHAMQDGRYIVFTYRNSWEECVNAQVTTLAAEARRIAHEYTFGE